MKERTRKWVDHFRHESIDPLVTSEPEDIHDKAKATVELENMNKRTRKWVDHLRHESIDPLIPSEFSAETSPPDIKSARIMYNEEDSRGNLRKQETNPDSKDIQNRFTKHLGSLYSLQILQEDDKVTESNTKGKNSDERKVDQSKQKISDPLSLSRFET